MRDVAAIDTDFTFLNVGPVIITLATYFGSLVVVCKLS